MLQLLHPIVHGLIRSLQPFLVPVCFGFAWLLIGMLIWGVWSAIRDTVRNAQQMHRIPCSQCQFFTNTHYLKCPVHPQAASSVEAINCPDYKSVRSFWEPEEMQ